MTIHNGQLVPRDGQPTSRNELSVDDGRGSKFVVYDGIRIRDDLPNNWFDLINQERPEVIYTESSFAGYNPAEHPEILKLASRVGTRIEMANPRNTAIYRADHNTKKTDAEDAIVIWKLAHSSYHMSPARPRPARDLSILEQANYDRRAFGWEPERNPSSAKALSYLSDVETVPEEYRDIVIKGKRPKKYKLEFVVPNAVAARYVIEELGSLDRDDFDREMGYYGHGRPSFLRHYAYHDMLPALVRRDTGWKHTKGDPKRIPTEIFRGHLSDDGKGGKIPTFKKHEKTFRKASRYIFADVKSNMGKPQPEVGNKNPE